MKNLAIIGASYLQLPLIEKAKEMGYDVLKASYTLKTKKAKGEIVDLGYLVSITYEYITFWEV